MPYSGWRNENKRKQKARQVLELFERIKNALEDEGDGDTSCDWCTRNGPQKLGKGAGRVGNWRTNQDHPNYSIVDIG